MAEVSAIPSSRLGRVFEFGKLGLSLASASIFSKVNWSVDLGQRRGSSSVTSPKSECSALQDEGSSPKIGPNAQHPGG